jgi:hypothetical protein
MPLSGKGKQLKNNLLHKSKNTRKFAPREKIRIYIIPASAVFGMQKRI